MTPDEIDETFVPRTETDLEEVEIGRELILLDGWSSATALNATGALIWDRFDGAASLEQVSSDLSRSTGVDVEVIRPDVVGLARHVAARGLLTNATPHTPHQPSVRLEPLLALEVGDQVTDPGYADLDGAGTDLADHLGPQSLLINWSPHCGYCWAIAEHLAVLTHPLAEAGVQLILVTASPVDANRDVAEAVDLRAPILVRSTDPDPFVGYGTPSAYHVDADARLLAPMALGTDQVLALASELAGVDPTDLLTDDDAEPIPAGTRYLLTDDGVCGPTTGHELPSSWSGTATYLIEGFHVGLRHDSADTAAVLDALFLGARVRDRRAGHSYSVTLNHRMPRTDPDDPARSSQALNLLVRGGRPLVRSRSAARILRALLWRLTDDIVGYETGPNRLRVDATAALVGERAVLLPRGLHTLGDSIQPRLARIGVGLADMPFPEIDLTSAELVIPEPAIPHDPTVLSEVDRPLDSSSELAPALPGRYPLIGWGVIHPGEDRVHRLSPAEAAAGTLSRLYEVEDAPARLRDLGELFTNIDAFGLWYHSEEQIVDAIGQMTLGPLAP